MRRFISPWLVVPCLLACTIAGQAAETFETRSSPSPLTDGTRIDITGEGRITATPDGRTLTLAGAFHGLATPATGKTLWQTRLPTSAQGHVIGYAVSGRQLLPGIHHPGNCSPIFVFARPQN